MVDPATARSPRGAVRLNGIALDACESWEIVSRGGACADRFTIRLATAALPPGLGADWFAAADALDAEIFASADPPPGWQPGEADRLMLGAVDDVSLDPLCGLVTLTGRDRTQRLIDVSFSVGYLNQTSSDIATALAKAHGLSPVVTATTTPIGTFYNQNHASLTQRRSAWDVLTELAAYEGFAVYVTGEVLHFEPLPAVGAGAYALVWQGGGDVASANVTRLRLDRSLTLAGGVMVTVRSWHAREGQSYSAQWPQDGTGSNALAYDFIAAGLTQDQCRGFAEARWREIAQHGLTLCAELPGDGGLDCRTLLTLSGTGTAWDGAYLPDCVERGMSAAEGYRMRVTAKALLAG